MCLAQRADVLRQAVAALQAQLLPAVQLPQRHNAQPARQAKRSLLTTTMPLRHDRCCRQCASCQ